MPTILGANTLSTGYEVENSLRFDDGSSAFLSKTFSGDGTSHDVGTVSVWLKRSDLIKGLPDLPKRSNAACFDMLSPVIN